MSGSEEAFLCLTCGTQYPPAGTPPKACPICDDERQYVGAGGQQWTTLETIRAGHHNVITEEEPGLISIQPEPKCGIGQRAFLVRTDAGNLLWDCVPLIDDSTVARVREHGGIAAIAISHPHYYSSMIEWSRAFENVPILLHADDSPWVMRPDGCIRYWAGERHSLFGGLSLVRTGGHFDGFQILHWPSGAEGQGVLLAGDQPFVCQDRRWVSFMYSYPNLIPLGPDAVWRIVGSLEECSFARLYGAFGGQLVDADAKGAVRRSAERYLRAVGALQ